MIIKIDYREKLLIEECKKQQLIEDTKYASITILSENIPLGDIVICNNDNEEQVIIERKTLLDLASSIKDGRYNEQSFRLTNCDIHNHNIIYLIEGDLRYYKPFKKCNNTANKNNLITKQTLLSAMSSIIYYKGFSLFKTVNIEESALWIMQFAYKLQKEKLTTPFYINQKILHKNEEKTRDIIISAEPQDDAGTVPHDAAGTVPHDDAGTIPPEQDDDADDDAGTVPQDELNNNYAQVHKRIKKNNINPNNIGIIILSQIPNVSVTAATAIMEKYNNIKNLMDNLIHDSIALNNISIVDKNGNKRKINKTCILNIYKFLISPTENKI